MKTIEIMYVKMYKANEHCKLEIGFLRTLVLTNYPQC